MGDTLSMFNDGSLAQITAARLHPLSYFLPTSGVVGGGLPDLPGRLGRPGGEEDVRPEDGQVHAGQLHRALGLYPGHHQHPGRPDAVPPCLHPGEPAGQAGVRKRRGGGGPR